MPPRIDRYEVLGRLGAGGMGVVYEAVDPELARPVAIKLLHRVRAQDGDVGAAKRLVREGQALAQLNHPHVVQIFGAGLDRGQVWLAMELVRGQTLKQWAATHRANPGAHVRATLALLEQAGRGLSAAHQRGLVHRDFKPANVLVGDDGRVRVVDFGLARMTRADPDAPQEHDRVAATQSEPAHGPGVLHLAVTQAGAAVGTPRYMAPEQLQGQPADARSDQFALAATAWELLHGAPPFDGTNGLDRLAAIKARQFNPTRHPQVPRWMTAALQRALSYRAARRFASIDALLAALSRSRRRRRLRWRLAGAGSLTAATIVGLGGWLGPPQRTPRCSEADARQRLAEIWHPARRTAVFAGLRSTDVPYAIETMRSVEAEVEAFSTGWITNFVAACASNTLSERDGLPTVQSRHACLGDSLDTLDAVLARLETADPKLAERATTTVRSVPRPDDCTEARAITFDLGVTAELGSRLAAARASYLARDTERALNAAQAVAVAARQASLERLEGDALELIGKILVDRMDPDAGQHLERAYAIAVGLNMDVRAQSRARHLLFHNLQLSRRDEARNWLRQVGVAIRRTHRNPADDAEFNRLECSLLLDEGRITEAIPRCERAVAIAQRASNTTTASLWSAKAALASAYRSGGHGAAAAEIEVALRDDARRRLGQWHPNVGGMELNLGMMASRSKRFGAAMLHYTAALRVFERAYGPRHRWVLSTLMNAAAVDRAAGRTAAAERRLTEAIRRLGETKNSARSLVEQSGRRANLARSPRRGVDDT